MELNTQDLIKRVRKPGISATPNMDRLVQAAESGWDALGKIIDDESALTAIAVEASEYRRNMEQAAA